MAWWGRGIEALCGNNRPVVARHLLMSFGTGNGE